MKHPLCHLSALVLAAGGLMPGMALAYDSHDFTTTASTAGTTAYIVGKHNEDDLARAHDFAHSQRVALQREAARGAGEHVEALADLLHENPQHFGPWIQSHFDALYSDPQTRGDLVDRITALRTG